MFKRSLTLLLSGLLLAACQRTSGPGVLPSVVPSFTPRPTEQPILTLPPAITQVTFTPRPTLPATATLPASATPSATATRRPAAVTLPPAPTPTSDAAWSTGKGGGAHGVTGSLSLNAKTTTFKAGSRVVYTMILNNTTGAKVRYGILGVGAYPLEGGSVVFGVAWDAAVTPNGYLELAPGGFRWSTYIIPVVPGRYAVHIGMCFSLYPDCGSSGDWESLSPDIFITVN
jgi:hypothetical protein